MSTEAQIKANRQNSQKSTGPRSPEGKAVVSKNAVKHGLFASENVLKKQSQSAPAQMGAKSFAGEDYENKPRPGLRENKAKVL
jgi:hypothetical protein